jgi:hypothetical protein
MKELECFLKSFRARPKTLCSKKMHSTAYVPDYSNAKDIIDIFDTPLEDLYNNQFISGGYWGSFI